MWSAVDFFEDKSVEAVPSYWVLKNKCAWPKKNSKKFIDRRVKPDEIDFDFLKARKLGKDVDDSYNIAQERVIRAQYTSDLSTYDSSSSVYKDQNKKPIVKTKVKERKKDKNCSLWSPTSSPNSYNILSDDSIGDPNFSPPGTTLVVDFPSSVKESFKTKLLNVSNSCPSTTVIPVKRKLQFDQKYYSLSPASSKQKQLKVADLDDEMLKTNKLDSSCVIINTTASPFKVTHISQTDSQYSPNILSNPKKQQKSELYDVFEFPNKMNRTLYSIKYDIQSLNDKVDSINDKMDGQFSQVTDNRNPENIFLMELSNLPLETEEELEEFENKLKNIEFRTILVAELKRCSRATLPSTIRAIMRTLFKDILLEKYSYKGLKKKKVFYTLTICTVIYDAIKQMKKFCMSDKIDIETPLRTFISGAKFRDPSNLKNHSTEAA